MSATSAAGLSGHSTTTVGLTTFLIGFSISLLAGNLLLHKNPGSDCSLSFADSHHRQCSRPTRSGLCVEDVFDAVDSVYRDKWPGTVDLLIRSSVSGRFFLMEMVFETIDHMWPKGIGDVVLVLDDGDQEAVSLVPPWIKVFFEKNDLNLPPGLIHQWSYGWADKYTTADFVAIGDDDVMFIMKVTPPLLFNLTEGKPYIIGSERNQSGVWFDSTDYFVGKGLYKANFMVQQPFVAPRSAFKAFREHVVKIHPESKAAGGYDMAFKWFTTNAPKVARSHVQHTALGNFLYNFAPEKIHFAFEWTYDIPIPRVAAPVPWTTAFLEGSNFAPDHPRYSPLYITSAAKYAHEGLCLSFPHGELLGCEAIREDQKQSQVWRYAHDWQDWLLLLYKRDEDGTQVYDEHTRVMHCIYHRMAKMNSHGMSGSWRVLSKKTIKELQSCTNHQVRDP